jgi:hypothetical protein
LPLKWISLFLLATLPIFTTPNWCIREGLNKPGIHADQCDPENHPNSNLTKLPPVLTTFLTLASYALLSIFIIMRLFIKKRSNSAKCRSICMGALMLISAIDLIWVLIDENKSTTWIVNIFNVFLVLVFIRAIREIWIQFSIVMIKSVPVFIIMLSYFLLFVIIGFIMFANNPYDKSFFTINESLYTVFILFTVSNYPDIQTPYFEQSRMSMLYFWVFLLIGIFLLSNLLLA